MCYFVIFGDPFASKSRYYPNGRTLFIENALKRCILFLRQTRRDFGALLPQGSGPYYIKIPRKVWKLCSFLSWMPHLNSDSFALNKPGEPIQAQSLDPFALNKPGSPEKARSLDPFVLNTPGGPRMAQSLDPFTLNKPGRLQKLEALTRWL